MIKYIVFENEQEYRQWEEEIKQELNISSYGDPHTNIRNDKVCIPYKPQVNTENLKIISVNKAIIKGFTISDNNEKALENYVNENYEFAFNLQKQFVTENIALGITQLGLTRPVSEYLADIVNDINNTSFYEVITKIDEKINEGVPQELSPVITEERLLNFKNKILEYLD